MLPLFFLFLGNTVRAVGLYLGRDFACVVILGRAGPGPALPIEKIAGLVTLGQLKGEPGFACLGRHEPLLNISVVVYGKAGVVLRCRKNQGSGPISSPLTLSSWSCLLPAAEYDSKTAPVNAVGVRA
jgi:hypothetical protein